jgi:hypothetical protein
VTLPATPPPGRPGRLRRFLRRTPLERSATAVIAAGVFMLLQPFAMTLYSWSFLTILAGTLMFTVVSKLPD